MRLPGSHGFADGHPDDFCRDRNSGFSVMAVRRNRRQLNGPLPVVVDRVGNNVYIVDSSNNRIRK